MKVIDAIIKLQNLNQNSDLMVVEMKENGFSIISIEDIEEFKDSNDNSYVGIFPHEKSLLNGGTEN